MARDTWTVRLESVNEEVVMAKTLEERVEEIIVEQLGVRRTTSSQRQVHRGSWRRFPGHGRAGDGLRGGVRDRHSDEDAEQMRTVGDAIQYLKSTAILPADAEGPA